MNRAVAGAVVALALLAAGAWALHGRITAAGWSQDPRSMLKPGALSPLHEAKPELTDCNACHALDEPIPDVLCLECHDEIGRRRADGIGHHGRDLPGACHDCHVDHEGDLVVFDPVSFNHARAQYLPQGSHATLACEACHETQTGVAAMPTRMQYVGLPFARCTDCHDDPHRGELTADDARTCTTCHAEAAWTGRHLRFVHDRDTAFELDGAHAPLACAACHPPAADGPLASAAFTEAPTACAECHDDPHGGQFAPTPCRTCHTTERFDGDAVRFRHDVMTQFPLEGAHAPVACTNCHAAAGSDTDTGVVRYRATPVACSACHEDPHAGQFGDTLCSRCHQVSGFRGEHLRFRHRDLAAYPLGTQHARVACAACHVATTEFDARGTVRYRGTSQDCAHCHAAPHGEQFAGTGCATCHREEGFKTGDLRFRHADLRSFPLIGAHADLACSACHAPPAAGPASHAQGPPVAFRGVGAACSACHDDPHAGSLAPKPCTTCHAPSTWADARRSFDHAADARFALDTTHVTVECSACHATPVFRPTPAECAACHAAAADALAGRVRSGDTVATFPASPHDGLVGCRDCHGATDTSAASAPIAARCATCHTARYAKLHLDRTARLRLLAIEERISPERLRAAAHDFEGVLSNPR